MSHYITNCEVAGCSARIKYFAEVDVERGDYIVEEISHTCELHATEIHRHIDTGEKAPQFMADIRPIDELNAYERYLEKVNQGNYLPEQPHDEPGHYTCTHEDYPCCGC